MNEINEPKPVKLSLAIPEYHYRVRSRRVRHTHLIQFLIEGVEHDEDAQVMIREFVEDLAALGIETD